MSLDSKKPSTWFVVLSAVGAIFFGGLVAAVGGSLWSVVAGEDASRGLIVLMWIIAAIIGFAWPMHLYERFRAVQRQRRDLRRQIYGPHHEVPAHLDPGDAATPTAEERMAEYLSSKAWEKDLKDRPPRAEGGIESRGAGGSPD